MPVAARLVDNVQVGHLHFAVDADGKYSLLLGNRFRLAEEQLKSVGLPRAQIVDAVLCDARDAAPEEVLLRSATSAIYLRDQLIIRDAVAAASVVITATTTAEAVFVPHVWAAHQPRPADVDVHVDRFPRD